MVGYSEVLQTMGAIIIFSIILLNANHMITRNTMMQVEGELEQEVVAIAQDLIEEGRTKEFDEKSQGAAPPTKIPEDFTIVSGLGSDADDDLNGNGTVERGEFDDFDDYNNWNDVVKTEHGDFNIRAEVFYVDPNTFEKTTSQTTFKKMQVFIKSKFLHKGNFGNLTEYRLEFIRNYYAD